MQVIISNYAKKLEASNYPKLLLYCKPGGLITEKGVEWCKNHFKNLKTVYVGEGLHYIQEDHPHEIGNEISIWLKAI